MTLDDLYPLYDADRGTLTKAGQRRFTKETQVQGLTYAPYPQRVGPGFATAASELKRSLDIAVLPAFLDVLSKVTQKRFSQAYCDVRLYPQGQELTHWSDGHWAGERLMVMVAFVLSIPPDDSLDSMARLSLLSLFEESSWDPQVKKLGKKGKLRERLNVDTVNALLSDMGKAYAKATDNAVIAALTASGTAATGTAATAAGLQSFIATEGAAAFKGTSEYASNLVASTDQWAAILGYADTTGRSLYNAVAPQNASGNASVSSITGNVLGTNLYVDPNISVSGIVDESAFLVVPSAVTVYESPAARLQVNVIGTGEVQIGLYGYMGIAVKKAAGVRRYNLA